MRFLSSIFAAIGCTEPIHPENTWIKHGTDHVTIGCASSDESWKLHCKGGIWQGRIGNCTGGGESSHDRNGLILKLKTIITLF